MKQFPFFIYGTLLPGQPNFTQWAGAIMSLQPARALGCVLYDLGWYPMLIDSPGSQVVGLVASVVPQHYSRVLFLLDFLEGYDPADPLGGEYRRRLHVVTLSGGNQQVAWVYEGRSNQVHECPQIKTNWIDHSRRRPQML